MSSKKYFVINFCLVSVIAALLICLACFTSYLYFLLVGVSLAILDGILCLICKDLTEGTKKFIIYFLVVVIGILLVVLGEFSGNDYVAISGIVIVAITIMLLVAQLGWE